MKLEKASKKNALKEALTLDGLSIKPKNNKNTIEIKKVVITDKKLRSKYASKQMDKSLKRVYDKIYKFLTSEDDSENGIKACLSEIEKCKKALFNKYKEDLKNKKYKEYIAKIALTETLFKEKYYEREYFANLIDKMYKSIGTYEEEEIKGKSR